MELVEGVSLLDHINSLSGKGKRMPETEVWQVGGTGGLAGEGSGRVAG